MLRLSEAAAAGDDDAELPLLQRRQAVGRMGRPPSGAEARGEHSIPRTEVVGPHAGNTYLLGDCVCDRQ